MLTLRLEENLEKDLEKQSKAMGLSKSELVRMSIKKFLGSVEQPTAWELGKDLFGKFDSGDPKLSQNKRMKVAEKIKAKKG